MPAVLMPPLPFCPWPPSRRRSKYYQALRKWAFSQSSIATKGLQGASSETEWSLYIQVTRPDQSGLNWEAWLQGLKGQLCLQSVYLCIIIPWACKVLDGGMNKSWWGGVWLSSRSIKLRSLPSVNMKFWYLHLMLTRHNLDMKNASCSHSYNWLWSWPR